MPRSLILNTKLQITEKGKMQNGFVEATTPFPLSQVFVTEKRNKLISLFVAQFALQFPINGRLLEALSAVHHEIDHLRAARHK